MSNRELIKSIPRKANYFSKRQDCDNCPMIDNGCLSLIRDYGPDGCREMFLAGVIAGLIDIDNVDEAEQRAAKTY